MPRFLVWLGVLVDNSRDEILWPRNTIQIRWITTPRRKPTRISGRWMKIPPQRSFHLILLSQLRQMGRLTHLISRLQNREVRRDRPVQVLTNRRRPPTR